jgi:hypothetical protein
MEKTCSHCGEPTLGRGAKGYCGKCYLRWRKYGDASDSVLQRHPRKGAMCTNCGDPVSPSSALGYCGRCYQRWRAHGDPNTVLPRSLPPINRKYALNHEYFDAITTPEQAYWLGFLAADGAVLKTAKTYGVRLELAKRDAEHVRLFAQALGSDKTPQPSRTFVYVQLDSRHLVESLARLGITPRKSATAEPWNGPAELMPHYWRGLFDGDGCIHRRSRGNGTSWDLTQAGSRACVTGFAEWAQSVCGTRATPRHVKGGCWHMAIAGSCMPQKLTAALYGDAPVALARKLQLAREFLAIDLRGVHGRKSNPH